VKARNKNTTLHTTETTKKKLAKTYQLNYRLQVIKQIITFNNYKQNTVKSKHNLTKSILKNTKYSYKFINHTQ